MKKILILSFLIVLSTTIFAQCMEASSDDEGVQIVGYLQTQYDHRVVENEDGNSVTENRFSFNRARMGLLGSIPYDFSYYIIFEFSPTKGNPYLLDGFITYSRFAPKLKVSMGKFKSPFGLELNTPCQGLHTINRSQVVNELTSPGRDIGLWFHGGFENILNTKYSLALTNGTGNTSFQEAEEMSITGRITFKPIEMLQIGGSYRLTNFNADVNPYITAADSLNGPTYEVKSFDRIGAELQFEYDELLVQGEYIMGKGYMETPIATSTDGGDTGSTGGG